MHASARVTRSATNVCPGCGKRSYRNRADARKAARNIHPGEHMRAYECTEPDGHGWHYGHNRWRWYRDHANAV